MSQDSASALRLRWLERRTGTGHDAGIRVDSSGLPWTENTMECDKAGMRMDPVS
jgi:hypothetical protein